MEDNPESRLNPDLEAGDSGIRLEGRSILAPRSRSKQVSSLRFYVYYPSVTIHHKGGQTI